MQKFILSCDGSGHEGINSPYQTVTSIMGTDKDVCGCISVFLISTIHYGPAAVAYGLERINSEVAAWMRGDSLPDGKFAQPPFPAMGCGFLAFLLHQDSA